jgi:hypothetical protein
MDGEFESLRGNLLDKCDMDLNTVSNNEHAPEVERSIHTIKE